MNPDRRSACKLTTGIERVDRFTVIVDAGVHGSYETDVICDGAEVRHKLTEIHATVAVFSKSPWTSSNT